ncbi:hypothetical protein CLV30_11744 [Haloactinopolyspora alba]|uniref:TIGR01777 family protein n=1 Tax=Haloactinopolyspora alba TaxID=648780 RepID=A0A2P8DR99_9ACTN|nr:TIGR01777 family oxidoreductase [Haloactinopolyspora alba]PSK99741.1 hypothetical protein CLV30_11744 [Haloactinopolyspora alba]
MKVAISGGGGFVGTALRASLRADGHDVLRLVRRKPAGPHETQWDPAQGVLDVGDLAGVEAVVNLAGAGVGARRWSRSYKRLVHDSRIRSTALLASGLAQLAEPPRVLVSASGVSLYGPDRGDEVLDEESDAGDGFLAGLCHEWEQAAAPARAADIAICHSRFGIVMDRSGGALGRLLPWYRLGLGGTLGNGRQFWSPISLHDTVRALRFLIEQHGCVGPYNLTAPEPLVQAEFSRVLGQAVSRPRLLPVPETALRLAVGQYATEIVGSLNVLPTRLTQAGFEFDHPDARSIVGAGLTGFH